MLRKIAATIEKRRARVLAESLHAWYDTCVTVTGVCRDALRDEDIAQGDIGVVLDKVDRQLFQFRNHTTDARREVRRADPELAQRLLDVSHEVYNLRNQMARFLIRAQGPSPFAAGLPVDPDLRKAYYLNALDAAGYTGREIAEKLQRELNQLWPDLEGLLRKAEQTIDS